MATVITVPALQVMVIGTPKQAPVTVALSVAFEVARVPAEMKKGAEILMEVLSVCVCTTVNAPRVEDTPSAAIFLAVQESR